MSTRAVLTGAGGFIGRHLSRALQASGMEVVAIRHQDADVTDAVKLMSWARPAEVVIHLAFPTSRSQRHDRPVHSLQVAIAGTANALALMQACEGSHFILASSGKVYGIPSQLPSGEESGTVPTTFLGELKLFQEQIVRLATRKNARHGASCLRLFNVYGPDASAEWLIPTLLSGFRAIKPLVVGELDHRRDWIHVEDVCSAFLAAIRNPPDPGQVRPLNVGCGRSVSLRELIEIMASVAGRRPEVLQEPSGLRPDESPDERSDCCRMRSLEWQPRIDLETGIRLLWEASGNRPPPPLVSF